MKRFVPGNAGWMLLSLGISSGAWMVVNASRELTMSVSAPVQYRNIPRALENSAETVEEAHLTLRGPSTRLSRIERGSLPVIVDLRSVTGPGEKTFTLNSENVDLPAGVTLERVIPAQIRMTLETRISRSVPVVVRASHLPEGMSIAHQEAVPSTVRIIGPESRVQKVKAVETDPVDLRALSAQEEVLTNVYSGDPQVQLVNNERVRVRVKLEPAKDQ